MKYSRKLRDVCSELKVFRADTPKRLIVAPR
jgi:hypothetical protein